MVKKKVVFLCIIIIFCSVSVGQAATLNLGKDIYKLQMTNFNAQSSLGDLTTLSLGYGVDQYTGYGLDITSGNQLGIVEAEYQFIPESRRTGQKEFDYAFKVGAVSGNYWEEEEPGGKVGLVLFKQAVEKQIYFDGDLIAGGTNLFDLEFGLRGEISPGILGVLGYKVVASQQNTVEGVQYGIKVDF